jgi:hypothetical protein
MIDLELMFNPEAVEFGARLRYGRPLGPDDLPGDWRVWFEERAAIMEYDGGLPRELAEAEALAETVREMQKDATRRGGRRNLGFLLDNDPHRK